MSSERAKGKNGMKKNFFFIQFCKHLGYRTWKRREILEKEYSLGKHKTHQSKDNDTRFWREWSG